MQTVTELALSEADRGVFTRDQAALWVGNRGARLDALLKRAVGRGEVWRVHRGLYCLSDRYARDSIEELDWVQARRDVERFVKPHELPSLELWTREYFLQQCAKLGQLS